MRNYFKKIQSCPYLISIPKMLRRRLTLKGKIEELQDELTQRNNLIGLQKKGLHDLRKQFLDARLSSDKENILEYLVSDEEKKRLKLTYKEMVMYLFEEHDLPLREIDDVFKASGYQGLVDMRDKLDSSR